jgi:hypothetical protein
MRTKTTAVILPLDVMRCDVIYVNCLITLSSGSTEMLKRCLIVTFALYCISI